MSVSLARTGLRLHRTHDVVLMPNLGNLYGCVRCWRLIAFRRGTGRSALTLVATQPCVENVEMRDAMRDVVNAAVQAGRKSGALIGASLGTALRGQREGRHAAGS